MTPVQRTNLKMIAINLLNIPQEMFDMNQFRGEGNSTDIECNTVGCVIGHSVHLDPNPDDIPYDEDGNIGFNKWIERFTGIVVENNRGHYTEEYLWCFYDLWSDNKRCNHKGVDGTPRGASKRIMMLLNGEMPNNVQEVMYGHDYVGDPIPLPYSVSLPINEELEKLADDLEAYNESGMCISNNFENLLDVVSNAKSGGSSFSKILSNRIGLLHDDLEWEYFFSNRWMEIDNDHIKGIYSRIRHYLKHGLPTNYELQMDGKATLTYKN